MAHAKGSRDNRDAVQAPCAAPERRESSGTSSAAALSGLDDVPHRALELIRHGAGCGDSSAGAGAGTCKFAASVDATRAATALQGRLRATLPPFSRQAHDSIAEALESNDVDTLQAALRAYGDDAFMTAFLAFADAPAQGPSASALAGMPLLARVATKRVVQYNCADGDKGNCASWSSWVFAEPNAEAGTQATKFFAPSQSDKGLRADMSLLSYLLSVVPSLRGSLLEDRALYLLTHGDRNNCILSLVATEALLLMHDPKPIALPPVIVVSFSRTRRADAVSALRAWLRARAPRVYRAAQAACLLRHEAGLVAFSAEDVAWFSGARASDEVCRTLHCVLERERDAALSALRSAAAFGSAAMQAFSCLRTLARASRATRLKASLGVFPTFDTKVVSTFASFSAPSADEDSGASTCSTWDALLRSVQSAPHTDSDSDAEFLQLQPQPQQPPQFARKDSFAEDDLSSALFAMQMRTSRMTHTAITASQVQLRLSKSAWPCVV